MEVQILGRKGPWSLAVGGHSSQQLGQAPMLLDDRAHGGGIEWLLDGIESLDDLVHAVAVLYDVVGYDGNGLPAWRRSDAALKAGRIDTPDKCEFRCHCSAVGMIRVLPTQFVQHLIDKAPVKLELSGALVQLMLSRCHDISSGTCVHDLNHPTRLEPSQLTNCYLPPRANKGGYMQEETTRSKCEREALYKEVWAEPVRTVAERYGVSDVALAKICKKLAIPLPGRGYWAKKKAGQPLPAIPLPPLPEGVWPTLSIQRGGGGYRRSAASPDSRHGDDTRLVVLETLTEAHPLVAQALRLLGDRKPTKGIISRPRRRCLDVLVSQGTLDRALRVMDALLKALEVRGLTVEATAPKEEEQPCHHWTRSVTRVLVDGEWIEFGLSEQQDVVRASAPEAPKHLKDWQRDYWIREHTPAPEYVPNGALTLEIKSGEGLGVRRTWRDGKSQRVENCLGSFIAHLGAIAGALKEHREREERREREWAEQQLRWEEERQRRWEEERRIKELQGQLERWRLARDVRAYVEEIRRASRAQSRTLPASVEGRLEWASAFAGQVDPVPGVLEEGAID
jgi:hypothetical protein